MALPGPRRVPRGCCGGCQGLGRAAGDFSGCQEGVWGVRIRLGARRLCRVPGGCARCQGVVLGAGGFARGSAGCLGLYWVLCAVLGAILGCWVLYWVAGYCAGCCTGYWVLCWVLYCLLGAVLGCCAGCWVLCWVLCLAVPTPDSLAGSGSGWLTSRSARTTPWLTGWGPSWGQG